MNSSRSGYRGRGRGQHQGEQHPRGPESNVRVTVSPSGNQRSVETVGQVQPPRQTLPSGAGPRNQYGQPQRGGTAHHQGPPSRGNNKPASSYRPWSDAEQYNHVMQVTKEASDNEAFKVEFTKWTTPGDELKFAPAKIIEVSPSSCFLLVYATGTQCDIALTQMKERAVTLKPAQYENFIVVSTTYIRNNPDEFRVRRPATNPAVAKRLIDSALGRRSPNSLSTKAGPTQPSSESAATVVSTEVAEASKLSEVTGTPEPADSTPQEDPSPRENEEPEGSNSKTTLNEKPTSDESAKKEESPEEATCPSESTAPVVSTEVSGVPESETTEASISEPTSNEIPATEEPVQEDSHADSTSASPAEANSSSASCVDGEVGAPEPENKHDDFSEVQEVSTSSCQVLPDEPVAAGDTENSVVAEASAVTPITVS